MPIYEFRCSSCAEVSSRMASIGDAPKTVKCDQCGKEARRIISRPSVHLSNLSKVEKLDPKYDKMVDKAMKNTASADPDRYLKKMKPYSEGKP